jgi:uncharacterized damage-inducible protein DinB
MSDGAPHAADAGAAFLARSRYYLREEYPAKLRLALGVLPAPAVWWRPNETSNSVGNLVLHLAGNVRQWIVGGVGGAADARVRAAEFARRDGPGVDDLLATLDEALAEADAVLAALAPADLAARRTIQGREVSVMEAIYHVVEHFSMHTGQIILLAKLHAPGALRFYEDAGGLARPLWRPPPG